MYKAAVTPLTLFDGLSNCYMSNFLQDRKKGEALHADVNLRAAFEAVKSASVPKCKTVIRSRV